MKRITLSMAACLCLLGGQAFGGISFSASAPAGGGHQAYAANVDFSVVGSNLQVILTNTSLADALVPIDVLTGVFFDITNAGPLTRVSALLTSGSSVFYDADGQPAGGVVGGEWAYKSGFLGPHSATEGISSSGLGLFGPGDRFPGPDLQSPASPDGVQYGLLPAGDSSLTGNGGITGSGGLIKNSVTFLLSGLPSGLTTSELLITHVSFQYGTDLSEPNIEALPDGGPGGQGRQVPEPGSLLVWGLLGIAGVLYRRRQTA